MNDRGGCAPHRSLPRYGLHQRENGMAGRVMLAVVQAIALVALAAPAVRATSAGPPAQDKKPPQVVFDIPPMSERVEIDGRKNPEMIPQWDVWHAAFELMVDEVRPADRAVEGALEGRSCAGPRRSEGERQELPGLPGAGSQTHANAPDRRSEVHQRKDSGYQSRVSLAGASSSRPRPRGSGAPGRKRP